jgi:hypothetical protein
MNTTPRVYSEENPRQLGVQTGNENKNKRKTTDRILRARD